VKLTSEKHYEHRFPTRVNGAHDAFHIALWEAMLAILLHCHHHSLFQIAGAVFSEETSMK